MNIQFLFTSTQQKYNLIVDPNEHIFIALSKIFNNQELIKNINTKALVSQGRKINPMDTFKNNNLSNGCLILIISDNLNNSQNNLSDGNYDCVRPINNNKLNTQNYKNNFTNLGEKNYKINNISNKKPILYNVQNSKYSKSSYNHDHEDDGDFKC